MVANEPPLPLFFSPTAPLTFKYSCEFYYIWILNLELSFVFYLNFLLFLNGKLLFFYMIQGQIFALWCENEKMRKRKADLELKLATIKHENHVDEQLEIQVSRV